MNKTTEALMLAEEALGELRYQLGDTVTDNAITKYCKALAAICEALAEPDIEEMTLTQIAAKHEHAKNNAPYGFCPICGCAGTSREKRINGNDTCVSGHTYASKEAQLVETDGRCKECMAYNGHLDYCSKDEQTDEQGRPMTYWGGMKDKHEKRPPNCGTGYCSCIECIYGKDGCVADEGQCNDGCLARESVSKEALKLANEIDAEFCQGRISNHSGRKAAQMLRMLIEAPVQPVKQEPVAWHEPNAYGNVTTHKKWAEENGWLPLYTKE